MDNEQPTPQHNVRANPTPVDIEGKNADNVRRLYYIMVAVIAVLVVGFITLLVTVAGLAFTYMHDSQTGYQESRDAISAQNDKIDRLTEALNKYTRSQSL